MSITFRRLEVFVAAAADCNFRKTADRLGISQPSVSAQIRAIESHLGYQLFDRRCGGSAMLSHAGRNFLAHARDLVRAEGDLAAERLSLRRAQASILKVSAGPLILQKRIKPVLMGFQERHPNIALEFVPFNPSNDGEKALRSGTIDVLMYTGGPPQKARSQSEIVTRASCSIYGSSEYAARLAGTDVDLSTVPFLIPPKHYRITQWLDSQLATLGIRPRNVVARPPYMDVVLQMAAAGKGIAVLFDEHVAGHAAGAQLRPVSNISIAAFRVMMLGRRALRPEAAPALRFLRDALRPS